MHANYVKYNSHDYFFDNVLLKTEHRMNYSPKSAAPRTDDSFLSKRDRKYHNYDSNLEILGIGMISQIPLCVLHLIDLGVTRKILNYYIKRYMNKNHRDILNDRLIKFKKYSTDEFNGKTKSLIEFAHWKGHDFRRFILYEGPTILRGLVPSHVYDHFLLLHCSYRILFMSNKEELLDMAQRMLEEFVEKFSEIFGNNLTYNVHNLLHLTQFVRLYGQPDGFSTYKFENSYQVFKKVGFL